MPSISPTILLVAGSMRKTLSPAALVWTITTRSLPAIGGARRGNIARPSAARGIVRRASRGEPKRPRFLKSRIDGRSYDRRAMGLAPSLLVLALLQQAPALDFEGFRTRIQPVFLEKREGHARCVVCHTRATTPFRLQPLSPGSTSWNDEESRRNFEAAERLVVPGEPLGSRLLTMALAEEAGGD